MIEFFSGLLLTAAVLSACFFSSVLIIRYKQGKTRPTPEAPPAEETNSERARVYYISSPPKKKRKPKPTNIALKGAMLPEGTVVVTDNKVIPKPTVARSPSRRKVPPSTSNPSGQKRVKSVAVAKASSPPKRSSKPAAKRTAKS